MRSHIDVKKKHVGNLFTFVCVYLLVETWRLKGFFFFKRKKKLTSALLANWHRTRKGSQLKMPPCHEFYLRDLVEVEDTDWWWSSLVWCSEHKTNGSLPFYLRSVLYLIYVGQVQQEYVIPHSSVPSRLWKMNTWSYLHNYSFFLWKLWNVNLAGNETPVCLIVVLLFSS